MLRPVGPLPAAVYWRRRLLVLTLLVALVGGGTWVALSLEGPDGGHAAQPAAAPRPAAGPAALDQVVPSVAAVQLPGSAVPSAAPTAPGACPDDALRLEVRVPAPTAPAGRPVELQLVVTNTGPAACTRVLDAGLQEVVLLDGGGQRLWGSADCRPGTGSDTRTLAPGAAVSLAVPWSGRTSSPGCAGQQGVPVAGDYVLRGRLDTKTTGDTRLTLT